MRQDVEAGSTLADAMRRHPKAFDNLYVNMIAAGEAGGILDTILQRLSVYIEKAVKLRSQVRSAMIYPVAVIFIAAIVVAVILLKVIPTFAALFTSLGAELPLPDARRHRGLQLPRPILHLRRHRDRRLRLRRPPLLPDLPGPARDRRTPPARPRSSE